jgi:hypothetical protein
MRISAVKRRNAWRHAIREVGVLFVAFGLGDFAYTIFSGKAELLPVLFLAILLNVAGLFAINFSIETEEETDKATQEVSWEEWGEIESRNEEGPERWLGSISRKLMDAIPERLAKWKHRQHRRWPGATNTPGASRHTRPPTLPGMSPPAA